VASLVIQTFMKRGESAPPADTSALRLDRVVILMIV